MLSEYPELVEYAAIAIFLWILMQLYFSLANRFKIIDKPNLRSSHSKPTIRGGGIIIVIALISWFFIHNLNYPWLLAGACMIAVISFADDVKPRHAGLRFIIQLGAFALMLYQIPMISPWWMVLLIVVIGIGALNAFNFMDGINGITGTYALVNLLTFLYADYAIAHFIETNLLIYVFLGVLVFLFYNFRTVARCFAGDVGSVVLAYLQIFLVLSLVYATGDYRWVLFFLIYGIDSVSTIVYRIINRENIFKAHRTHLYQYLANEGKHSHLAVSALYGAVQLCVNIVLLISYPKPVGWFATALIAGMTLLYLFVRELMLKRIGREGVIDKLLKKSPQEL